jgi:hypothetical protein
MVRILLPRPRTKYMILLTVLALARCEFFRKFRAFAPIQQRQFSPGDDPSDICPARLALVSFAQFGGTAVSRPAIAQRETLDSWSSRSLNR